MKTLQTISFYGLLAFFMIFWPGTFRATAQPGSLISFQTFYEELSPYGGWITHPAYGSVWVPDAGPDFRPYGTGGYWVMTQYGNTWVSDYAWGWAPFHYGRWFYDDYYGWAWVPGHEWGPAWVAWRSGGGYYGWAPLGPGVNIQVNIIIPAHHWVFVPQRYIAYPQPYRYCAPRHRVVNIYHNTVHIHNTYRNNDQVYAYGPDRDDISRATRREVPVYRVEEVHRPGRTAARNGAVEVYRPRVTPEAPGDARPGRAPGSVMTQPGPSRGRPAEEGYRESRNYPREDARAPRVRQEPQLPQERRTEYPARSPRETGGYGQRPEDGRVRQQTGREPSAREGQQRPARRPAPAEEPAGQRESTGYSRPRRG